MTEHDEHIKQCQECSRNKAIADSVFVIDSDLLEELESREPRPYAPFVERLKSLEKTSGITSCHLFLHLRVLS